MCWIRFWNLQGMQQEREPVQNLRMFLLNGRTIFPFRDHNFGWYSWEKDKFERYVPVFQRQMHQPWLSGHRHCSFSWSKSFNCEFLGTEGCDSYLVKKSERFNSPVALEGNPKGVCLFTSSSKSRSLRQHLSDQWQRLTGRANMVVWSAQAQPWDPILTSRLCP